MLLRNLHVWSTQELVEFWVFQVLGIRATKCHSKCWSKFLMPFSIKNTSCSIIRNPDTLPCRLVVHKLSWDVEVRSKPLPFENTIVIHCPWGKLSDHAKQCLTRLSSPFSPDCSMFEDPLWNSLPKRDKFPCVTNKIKGKTGCDPQVWSPHVIPTKEAVQSIWVNYNISLPWIKAILGWFPFLIIVRSRWGRYNLPRSMNPHWESRWGRRKVGWRVRLVTDQPSHLELHQLRPWRHGIPKKHQWNRLQSYTSSNRWCL